MKRAFFFTEGTGMYAFGCKTPEEAVEIMQKSYREEDSEAFVAEYYGFGIEEIKVENIKKDRAYLHRICGYTTIGENWCGECGEQTKGNGREVFVLNL